MSVRKRTWTTAKGVEKEAWVVDDVEKTKAGTVASGLSPRRRMGPAFEATANVEVRAGAHTADSASKTIAEAGALWLQTGEAKGLGSRLNAIATAAAKLEASLS